MMREDPMVPIIPIIPIIMKFVEAAGRESAEALNVYVLYLRQKTAA